MVEYGGAVGGAAGGVSSGGQGVSPHVGGIADSIGASLDGLFHGAMNATAGVSPVVLVAGLVLVLFAVIVLRRAL